VSVLGARHPNNGAVLGGVFDFGSARFDNAVARDRLSRDADREEDARPDSSQLIALFGAVCVLCRQLFPTALEPSEASMLASSPCS
jgi:hypothetical protein